MKSESDTTRDSRRKRLALIHIARKEMGLSDDEYRDVIASVFPRATSCTQLNLPQLDVLLLRFREMGWRPSRRRPFPPMVWKARALWLELHQQGAVHNSSWSALGRYARRMTGEGDLRKLSTSQAVLVIESLKKWLARVTSGRGSNH